LTETKENGTIISMAEDNEDFVFYSGIDLINEAHPTEVQLVEDGNIGYLYRIGVGDTAGFKITELTYPGELLAQAGEPLTTVLDKIKNMLGEFEYFYNLEGKFVF
jgi:hypothetical protein